MGSKSGDGSSRMHPLDFENPEEKVYVGAGTGILAAVGLAGLAVSEELRRELSYCFWQDLS